MVMKAVRSDTISFSASGRRQWKSQLSTPGSRLAKVSSTWDADGSFLAAGRKDTVIPFELVSGAGLFDVKV